MTRLPCHLPLRSLGLQHPSIPLSRQPVIVILMLDLWLAKDNRFLNPKSSYERILLAPPCRLINDSVSFLHSFTLLFIHGLISYLPSSFSSFIIAFTLIIGFLISAVFVLLILDLFLGFWIINLLSSFIIIKF